MSDDIELKFRGFMKVVALSGLSDHDAAEITNWVHSLKQENEALRAALETIYSCPVDCERIAGEVLGIKIVVDEDMPPDQIRIGNVTFKNIGLDTK